LDCQKSGCGKETPYFSRKGKEAALVERNVLEGPSGEIETRNSSGIFHSRTPKCLRTAGRTVAERGRFRPPRKKWGGRSPGKRESWEGDWKMR